MRVISRYINKSKYIPYRNGILGSFLDFEFLGIYLLYILIVVLLSIVGLASTPVLAVIGIFVSLFYWDKPYKILVLFILTAQNSLSFGGNFFGIINDPFSTDISLTIASNLLVYIVVFSILASSHQVRLKFNFLDILVIIFFVYSAATIFYARDQGASIDMLRRMTLFIAFYFIIRLLINSVKSYEFYLRAFITISFLILVLIIYQVAIGYISEQGEGRPHSAFLVIPLLLAFFEVETNARWRWLYFGTAFLAGFLSQYSASRRVFLIVIGFFATYMTRQRLFFTFILLGLAAYLVFPFIPDYSKERLDYTFVEISQFDQDNTDPSAQLRGLTTGRSDLWEIGIVMFLENPILGMGLANSREFITDYGFGKDSRLHNFYLTVLVDLGMIGFIILILIILSAYSLYTRGIRMLKKAGERTYVQLGFALRDLFILMHVTAFFGSSMLYSKGGWLSYALAASFYIFAKELAYLKSRRIKAQKQ